MADAEPLWRSRLRWRLRGALQWPVFFVLTVVDALLLGALPITGMTGTPFVGALLLSLFFNLLAVAVFAPLLAWALRRRRRDLPRIVAEDMTGTALVVLVTLALLAGGLIHKPVREEEQRDYFLQLQAAREFAHTQAPAEFRGNVQQADTLHLDDDLYRTCVPGDDVKSWFCMIVDTEGEPPGIKVDESGTSNASYDVLGRYR